MINYVWTTKKQGQIYLQLVLVKVKDTRGFTKYGTIEALETIKELAMYEENPTIHISYSPYKSSLSPDNIVITGLHSYELRQVDCIL